MADARAAHRENPPLFEVKPDAIVGIGIYLALFSITGFCAIYGAAYVAGLR